MENTMDYKDFENELISLLYGKGVIITEKEANDILTTLLAEGYTISKEVDDTCPYYSVSTVKIGSMFSRVPTVTKEIYRCMGTKEMDECSCEGLKSKCDRHKDLY